jgi:hypothetical protein
MLTSYRIRNLGFLLMIVFLGFSRQAPAGAKMCAPVCDTVCTASSPCGEICTGESGCNADTCAELQCYEGYCGDGLCEWGPETRDTCPSDCGYCGDGKCQDAEIEFLSSWCTDDCGPAPSGTCGECDHTNQTLCDNGDICDLYDCCDTPDSCLYQNGASCTSNECCSNYFCYFGDPNSGIGQCRLGIPLEPERK